MGILQRLAVVISGDDKGAVAAAEQSAVAMEKAAVAQAKLTVAGDRLAVAQAKVAVVEAKNAGDAETLAVATAALTAAQEQLAASTAAANVAQAEASYAAAQRSLQSMTVATQQQTAQSKLMGSVTGASTATLVAGAAAGVLAEEKLAQSFSDTTEATRKFRDIAGTTTDQASRYKATFDALGVPIDKADTAVGKLAKTLGNTPDALDKFGVSVQHNKNGTVDLAATLLAVGDRYNALADPTQRAALASAAFGRGYTELIPVLRANRDALKEFGDAAAARGEIWTDSDIKKGADFAIQMREAKTAVEAVGHQLGGAAAGSFTDLARLVGSAASSVAFLVHWMNQAKDAVDGWVARLVPHIPIVEKFGKAMFGGSDAAKALAASAADTAGEIDGIEDPTTKAADAVDGLVGAVQSYTGAVDKIGTANDRLAAAHDEIAKKADDQAKATRDADKADRDLTDAETRLADAQRRAPLDLAKARQELADATLKVEQADEDALIATEKFGRGSLKAREAAQAAADARGAQADASDKATEAEKAGLNTDAVKAAEQAIAEAKQHQADAAKEKTKADAEDPIADIAKAEQAVKDATLDELIARGKLNDAIATYNAQFQASVTLADVLDGKADDFLTKIVSGTLLLGQALADASTLVARTQAANDAAIGAGIVDADGTTLGPQDSTKANPAPKPSALQRAGDFILNQTINATLAPIDPNELAAVVNRQIASAMRSRVN